jgi:mRNA-degrading endonuclease YafQ of YafQ-DinJ toxin-antitoxin module
MEKVFTSASVRIVLADGSSFPYLVFDYASSVNFMQEAKDCLKYLHGKGIKAFIKYGKETKSSIMDIVNELINDNDFNEIYGETTFKEKAKIAENLANDVITSIKDNTIGVPGNLNAKAAKMPFSVPTLHSYSGMLGNKHDANQKLEGYFIALKKAFSKLEKEFQKDFRKKYAKKEAPKDHVKSALEDTALNNGKFTTLNHMFANGTILHGYKFKTEKRRKLIEKRIARRLKKALM